MTEEAEDEYLLIVYCPQENKTAVLLALFSVSGVGRFGNYEEVAYITSCEEEFRPVEGANPRSKTAVGDLERLDSIRIETNCPIAQVGLAVEAVRGVHMWEEPVIRAVRTLRIRAG